MVSICDNYQFFENITKTLELIAKNIDKFYFIVYYYHIVNEKYQIRTNIVQNRNVGVAQQLQGAEQEKGLCITTLISR